MSPTAYDRARAARRQFDLDERLTAHLEGYRTLAALNGWDTTEETIDSDDPDLTVRAFGAARPARDGQPGFLLVAALGISRRTGRVSHLVDPDRHNARVVVYLDDDSRRYWWSPKASAVGAALGDPAAFCGLDQAGDR